MSTFGSLLAAHLAKKLDVSIEDVTEALESFSPKSEPMVVSKKKTEPKKAVTPPPKKQVKDAPVAKKTDKTVEKHLCERIKKGQSEKCGKNASKCIEEGKKKRWFCGTEKGGCYHSELNILAKKESEKESVSKNAKSTATKKSSAPKTNEDRKVSSEVKSKSLVQKVIKQLDILPKKVNGKTLHMEKISRALIDPNTREFYGILDDDNQTVLPLDSKTIKMVESAGHTIRQEKAVKTQHKSRESHDTAKSKPEKKVVPEATVESENSEESLNTTKITKNLKDSDGDGLESDISGVSELENSDLEITASEEDELKITASDEDELGDSDLEITASGDEDDQ